MSFTTLANRESRITNQGHANRMPLLVVVAAHLMRLERSQDSIDGVERNGGL
jgi:hypothetical protein